MFHADILMFIVEICQLGPREWEFTSVQPWSHAMSVSYSNRRCACFCHGNYICRLWHPLSFDCLNNVRWRTDLQIYTFSCYVRHIRDIGVNGTYNGSLRGCSIGLWHREQKRTGCFS